MKTKTLAIAALALWGLSAAFVGYKFVTGTTITQEDGREAIILKASERNLILTEMRGMLAAVQEIIADANAGDMEAVKATAHTVGLAEVAGVPAELMLKLPMDFKKLGRATHAGFDAVGLAADFDAAQVLEKLEENLSRCVACHASYQLIQAP